MLKSQKPKCSYGPQQLIPFDSGLIDGILGFQKLGRNYLVVPYTYIIDGVEHLLDDDDYRYTNDDLEDEETIGTQHVEPECPKWEPLFEDSPVPTEEETEEELLKDKENWMTEVIIPKRIVREVVKAIRSAKSEGWRNHYDFENYDDYETDEERRLRKYGDGDAEELMSQFLIDPSDVGRLDESDKLWDYEEKLRREAENPTAKIPEPVQIQVYDDNF